jgi:hypothetical protein
LGLRVGYHQCSLRPVDLFRVGVRVRVRVRVRVSSSALRDL